MFEKEQRLLIQEKLSLVKNRESQRSSLQLYYLFPTILFIVLFLSFPMPLEAAVDCDDVQVSCYEGELASDETWSSDKIHVLTDDFVVPVGITLTIEAGTIVKVDHNTSDYFTINGTLLVNGTTGQPVIITSDRDDTAGGDTDNSTISPSRGNWNGLIFAPGSTGTLANAEVRYGGDNGDFAAVHVDGANVSLTNVDIVLSDWTGISASPTDSVGITDVTITESRINGFEIREGSFSGANTWDLTSIPYIPTGDLTIPAGASLTLEAGVIVKFNRSPKVSIFVDGTLDINGATNEYVVLTGLYDATAGGSTSTISDRPNKGAWNSIEYRPGSAGTIDYADIRFGGISGTDENGAIHVENGDVAITNSILRDNYKGLTNSGSNPLPTITNSELFENSIAIINRNSSVVLQATGNWWESPGGPDDRSDEDGIENVNQDGEDVSDYVDYSNFLIQYILPRLSIDRVDLEFSATVNDDGPDSPTVQVDNVGPGMFSWTATEDIPWLTLTNNSGVQGDLLFMSIDTTGLVEDRYNGDIWVTAPDVNLGMQKIEVELDVHSVEESASGLGTMNDPLSFAIIEGETVLPSDFFTIINTGTGTLDWTITETIPWLSLDRSSGAGESTVVGTVDPSGLAAGRYLQTLQLQSPTADGSPRSVDVNLSVGCSNPDPADVVLVMDRSASMSAAALRDAKNAAIEFVNRSDLTRDRVALVTFDTDAILESGLTQNRDLLIASIGSVSSGGGTDIAEGINVARTELLNATQNKVIILFSDGQSDNEAALREAFLAKVSDTLMITIGLGNGIDVETLTAAASTPLDFYLSPSSENLSDVYNQISVTVGCGAPVNSFYRTFTPLNVK